MKFALTFLLVALFTRLAVAADGLSPTLLTKRGAELLREDFSKPIPSIVAGKAYTTSYAYNLADHVTNVTYPSGHSFVVLEGICST